MFQDSEASGCEMRSSAREPHPGYWPVVPRLPAGQAGRRLPAGTPSGMAVQRLRMRLRHAGAGAYQKPTPTGKRKCNASEGNQFAPLRSHSLTILTAFEFSGALRTTHARIVVPVVSLESKFDPHVRIRQNTRAKASGQLADAVPPCAEQASRDAAPPIKRSEKRCRLGSSSA